MTMTVSLIPPHEVLPRIARSLRIANASGGLRAQLLAQALRRESALPGARRADVTGFGVPEHHGDGSALPMLVECGNLSLEIWSSGILMKPVAP